MPKKQKVNTEITPEKIGAWSFIIGVVIAIVVGLVGSSIGMPVTSTTVVLVLGLLGIIVGVLNVTDREVGLFLIATIAFLTAATALEKVLVAVPTFGNILNPVIQCVALFVAPGAAIIAIKALWDISKTRYA
jgi:uncharacterized membrane protein YbaN (DUF454 family)